MSKENIGASPYGDRAVVNGASGESPPQAASIPSAVPPKPFKAYAVLEEQEATGGVIYAKSSAAARRMGANEYADGDFSNVSCRRAPWADSYFEKPLPISVMIEAGWNFECSGCGRRIDEDYLCETDRLPEDIIGSQYSMVYCDAVCEAHDALETARRKRLETRWLRRFARFVKARFPDANPEPRHAYARPQADGRMKIAQVAVEFDFPGRQYGMAEMHWREKTSWEKSYPKPAFTCSAGDREAFEAYAAQGIEARSDETPQAVQPEGREPGPKDAPETPNQQAGRG